MRTLYDRLPCKDYPWPARVRCIIFWVLNLGLWGVSSIIGPPIRGVFALLCHWWLKHYGRHRISTWLRNPPSRRIVMLVVSSLDRDPRVERGARALARNGFHVTVICPVWPWHRFRTIEETQLDWGAGIDFRILSAHTANFAFSYPFIFGFRMLRAAVAENAWAYHAHDLNTALIALLAAAKNRSACICDFHEWYAENVTFDVRSHCFKPHPPLKRKVFEAIERLAIHSATELITVCDSIGEGLAQRYQAPKPIRIIRNIPFIHGQNEDVAMHEDLRKSLAIGPDKLIVLYQGGLGSSRNLEPVIEAMAQTPGAVFVIRGPNWELYSQAYQQLAQRVGAGGRVYCLPPVPSARVVAEAKAADVGLWTLLSNVGLNFFLALPNKVFEYLAAGLPLLVGDFPEVRRLVEKYGVGLWFDPDSPLSIAQAINRMAADCNFLESCRANIPAALEANQADREWEKLVSLYRGLLEEPCAA